jgi:hypothetical protein
MADEATMALMAGCLTAMDATADVTEDYVTMLEHLLTLLTTTLETGADAPDAAAEDVMRAALGKMDAVAGDQSLAGVTLLVRVRTAVERELFRWNSSMQQRRSPSGDTQVPCASGEWVPYVEPPA